MWLFQNFRLSYIANTFKWQIYIANAFSCKIIIIQIVIKQIEYNEIGYDNFSEWLINPL